MTSQVPVQKKTKTARVLSFFESTVASYQASPPARVDDNSMLERDIKRYEAYLYGINAQQELREFRERRICIRSRLHEFKPLFKPLDIDDVSARYSLLYMFLETPDVFYEKYAKESKRLDTMAHSETQEKYQEERIEGDRRELYGFRREPLDNTKDAFDPRGARKLLELIIWLSKLLDSDYKESQILNLCQPQRRVLQLAIVTESRLTLTQFNTMDAILEEARSIMYLYICSEPEEFLFSVRHSGAVKSECDPPKNLLVLDDKVETDPVSLIERGPCRICFGNNGDLGDLGNMETYEWVSNHGDDYLTDLEDHEDFQNFIPYEHDGCSHDDDYLTDLEDYENLLYFIPYPECPLYESRG